MDCICSQTTVYQNIFILTSTVCIFYTGFSIIFAIFGVPTCLNNLLNKFKPSLQQFQWRCQTIHQFINSIFSFNRPSIRLIVERKNGNYRVINLIAAGQSHDNQDSHSSKLRSNSPSHCQPAVLEEMKQEENSSETYIKLDNVDRPFSPINKSKSIRSSISERELCFDTALTNSDPAWNTEVLRSLTSNFFEDGISTIGFSTKMNPNNDRSANNLTLIENNNNNCKESLKGTVNGRSTSSLNIQLTSQPLLLDEEFEKVNIQS